MEQKDGRGLVVASKARETWAFLLVVAVIFPLIAVLVVAGYGFLVWMWQLFAGPPGGP
jgi:periplasmic nitrate reductase NapE